MSRVFGMQSFQIWSGSRIRGTFTNYFRLDENLFQELLTKVTPLIQKENTQMRKAVTPAQRLAVTLRYLATGCSYTELHYNFRISVSLLTTLIPEVCEAIYSVLKDDYMKLLQTVTIGW